MFCHNVLELKLLLNKQTIHLDIPSKSTAQNVGSHLKTGHFNVFFNNYCDITDVCFYVLHSNLHSFARTKCLTNTSFPTLQLHTRNRKSGKSNGKMNKEHEILPHIAKLPQIIQVTKLYVRTINGVTSADSARRNLLAIV